MECNNLRRVKKGITQGFYSFLIYRFTLCLFLSRRYGPLVGVSEIINDSFFRAASLSTSCP